MRLELVKHRWLLVSVGLFLNLSTLAAPAPAAPAPAASGASTAPAPKLATKPLVKAVAVPAALKRVLAGKSRYDEPKLAASLSYVGIIPQLKLPSGKLIRLEPIIDEPAIPAKSQPKISSALAQQLSKYRSKLGVIKYGRPTLQQTSNHQANQSAIRDQGTRGTCVAHAAVAALEAIYKQSGVERDLSENHAYNVFMQREGSTCMADPGLATWKAAGYLSSNLICEEAESPYIGNRSTACATVPVACNDHRTHGYVTTDVFFGTAFGGTGTQIANNTSFLESLIDSGYDIVMGFHLAGSGWSDGTASTGAIDVQIDAYGNAAPAFAGHAMLIVGYDAPANYFITKNSWGTDDGHAGYYHLTYEYVQTYAKYGFVVTGVTGL